ncbi:MAG: EamA/RhaT family transporter [Hydrogenophilales bacterium CG_4_9_14_3_um_filter_63_34]|nr:MAG: EamA/RhaT family transporter [Hydrogenophilales bacterium CG_4_10_14_3_um_filter_63_21]PJB03207.1 MAG: EamA/RhaT family transporter [Hydrogenophilales bacterium CG_4_9_14_3_um_filter_63_34]
MLSSRWLAPLALLVTATTWGLVWYPYRILEQAGLSGSVASVLTYLVALPPLLLLALRSRSVADPAERGLLLALALVSGWTNLAYVLAVIHGEVMRVMLLFYLAPLWTVPFARLLLNEHAGRGAWLVIALALAGAWAMLAGEGGFPMPHNAAEWLGLSAGVGFALANVLTRRLKSAPIAVRSLWVFAGVVAVSTLYASAEGATPGVLRVLDGKAWWLVAGIALALLLATFTMQYGLSHTPANRAVVILLAELVVAALSSRWLAGEVMDRHEWIGGAMIVAATLFSVGAEKDD